MSFNSGRGSDIMIRICDKNENFYKNHQFKNECRKEEIPATAL